MGNFYRKELDALILIYVAIVEMTLMANNTLSISRDAIIALRKNSAKLGDRMRFLTLHRINSGQKKCWRKSRHMCRSKPIYWYTANLIRSYQSQYISVLLITLATRWRQTGGVGSIFGKKRRPKGKTWGYWRFACSFLSVLYIVEDALTIKMLADAFCPNRDETSNRLLQK